MSATIDWKNPETFKLSDEAYERYLNDMPCLHNCVARENPQQSMLGAMLEHNGSYETTRINGKSIDEIIRNL